MFLKRKIPEPIEEPTVDSTVIQERSLLKTDLSNIEAFDLSVTKKKKKYSATDAILDRIDTKLTDMLFNDDIKFDPIVPEEKEETVVEEELPAWIDQYLDDVTINDMKGSVFEQLNRQKFLATNPNLKWLKPTPSPDVIFNSTQKLIDKVSDKTTWIAVFDANGANRSGNVHHVAFHPRSDIISIVDDTNSVRLFQVASHDSLLVDKYKVQGVHFADWISDNELVVLARNKYGFTVIDINKSSTSEIKAFGNEFLFKSFDKNDSMMAFASENNSVMLTSIKSKLKIGEIKMNSTPTKVSFSKDGNHLYTIGEDKIYIWDIRNGNRPISIHNDHGSINTLSIATSSKYYATGSSSGVVNIYQNGTTTPYKSLMNLVTGVDLLKFTHDGSKLIFASTKKSNTVRVCSFPTMKVGPVYQFDESPSHLDISSTDSFLAVGSQKRVRLFKPNKEFTD
jgi:U3 small nucleolar RNA-associated protein 18